MAHHSEDGLNPSTEDWQSRVGQSGPWDSRFQRLRDAVAGADNPAAAYNCVDLGPMLEAYVSDIRQGLDVSRQYEPLRAHLRTCSECRLEVESLTAGDAPLALSASEQPKATPDLPFLRTPAAAWDVQPRAQLHSPGRGVLIRFAPGFLAQRYQSGSTLAVRGAAGPQGDILLMAGQVESGDHLWHVQVQSSRPSAASDRMRVCVDVEDEPPERLRVALRWGEELFVQDVDDAGHTCFADLPAGVVFEAAPSLDIDVQVIDPLGAD